MNEALAMQERSKTGPCMHLTNPGRGDIQKQPALLADDMHAQARK
jgi:hypothetical protein